MKSVVEGENCFLSKGLDEKNNGFNDTTGNDDNFVKNGTKDFEMRDSAPQSSSWKHMSTDMRAEQLAQFITTHHREIGECMTCWMLVFDDSAVKMNANNCDGNSSSGEIGTDRNKGDGNIGKTDRLKPAMDTKYRSLLNISNLRDDVIFSFVSLSAQLCCLGSQSDLQILSGVGNHLVQPALVAAKQLIEGEEEDFDENNEIPIELELSDRLNYHSVFSCPVTWERSISHPITYDEKETHMDSNDRRTNSLFPFPLPKIISSTSTQPTTSSNVGIGSGDADDVNESVMDSPDAAVNLLNNVRGSGSNVPKIHQPKSANPPVLLNCGHCILQSSMETLSMNRTRRFKCPICYRDNSVDEVMELIF